MFVFAFQFNILLLFSLTLVNKLEDFIPQIKLCIYMLIYVMGAINLYINVGNFYFNILL